MSAMLDYMQLCRLCLVKEKVNVPIFGDDNDVRQIFLKITACLPVKVTQEDNLPKKICDSCLYKVDLLYQFWNTTVNAEKQLIQWLTEIGVDVNIKNSDTQTLPILPQSHAHPHSIPVPVPVLKEEGPDIVEKQADFQMPEQQNIYPGYDNLGYPQAEVTMEVGAANTFVQPEPVEEPPPPDPPAPTPKKRGRPAGATNKKSPPKKKPTPAPPPVVSPRTNSTRRSSATAAAAAVAAAAAAATDSEEDSDGDRLGGLDYEDSDSDEDHMAKEELDSDEDYVKPKSYLGVPSSADGEQPGPSGLGGVKGEATGANATESGQTYPSNAAIKSDSTYAVVGYVFSNMGQLIGAAINAPPVLLLNQGTNVKNTQIPSTVSINNTSIQSYTNLDFNNGGFNNFTTEKDPLAIDSDFAENNTNINFNNDTNFPTTKIINIKENNQKIHNQEIKKYKCPKCRKRYTLQRFLDQHLKKHEKFIQPKCDVCLKTFRNKTALRDHLLKKPPEKDYICTNCNLSFHSKQCYDFHILVENKKNLNCYKCNELFTDSASLKEHVRIVHNKKKINYQCDACGKAYSNNATYERHISVIHLG